MHPLATLRFTLKSALLTACLMLSILVAPSALAQKASPTPKPSATPKTTFDVCRPYPSATPIRQSGKPTPTNPNIPDAPIAPPAPTETPLTPSATPTTPANPTAIPVGKKPADALIQLRYSPTLQRNGKPCVMVYEVIPGGAADLAGLRAGDLLLGIEKTPILEIADFYDAVAKRAAGDTLSVTAQRNDEQSVFTLTLGLNPLTDPNATPILTATPTPKK